MPRFCSIHCVVLIFVALACSRGEAFFHLWRFSEFYSSPDGSVQFIELHTTGLNEIFSNGATITSASTGKVYTFHGNLTGPTTNKSLLIATSGFGSLPGGVTPDFPPPLDPLPPNFFNPNGDTLTLFESLVIDTKTFATVPTDGVMSLNYFPTAGVAVNSPTNYSGATGSVNLAPPPPPGDYNHNGVVDAADYVIWRETLSQTVSPFGSGADGNANGTIDSGDYDFWRARFSIPIGTGTVTASLAVPEPGGFSFPVIAALSVALRRRKRQ